MADGRHFKYIEIAMLNFGLTDRRKIWRDVTVNNNAHDSSMQHQIYKYGAQFEDQGPGPTLLNGLICLHSVLDKAGSQSVFKRT